MSDIYIGSLFSEDVLTHHGILGMKWGVRRYQNSDGSLTSAGKKRYSSTGLRAYMARKRNEKIDRSFKKWKENAERRENAISIGVKANESRMAYEQNRRDKASKAQYKADRKEYKSALKANTTYRKGQIRGEVGKDMSRRYLSEAKKVYSQLQADPNNKALQKRYSQLMSQHDIERDRARRAPAVGAARSRRIAAVKRGMTIGAKTVAATAAISAGVALANRYGKLNLSADNVARAADIGKKALKAARYLY